ncbi:hypothetical protein G4X40_12030 [Rhodococcus sp. D2-41]|uniref:Uncharacterized protein n=1 Tax=Speluncibacter jeojiensis TaxID=2710754 RepID=A0A9X4RGB9_9ACTN|nr:hypothetical protein [Rhodococcus sp. D2-41]MDG3010877.1 hypothetical protein [Rhodococcus sp. D2-41]MDG3013851.1 hypothetical protein [Corynebacteriales bacterium D3-21]
MPNVKRFYGAHPLHLLVLVASFALVSYVIETIGLTTLWNRDIWWQSILVWFVGAVILHDLVLFPLYAFADRSLIAGWRGVTGRVQVAKPTVSPVNYLRIPVLGSGLLFVLFFPGIVEQGQPTYLAATGQTQQPFLGRWLLLTAVMFAVSAVVYSIRLGLTRRHRLAASGRRATEAEGTSSPESSA